MAGAGPCGGTGAAALRVPGRAALRRFLPVLVPAAVLLAAAAPSAPLPAQQDAPAAADTAGDAGSGALLREADLAPAAVFVGALLLVEPLEGPEESLRARVSPEDGLDGALADAGGVAGDIRLDLGLAAGAWMLGEATGSDPLARIGRHAAGALAAAAVLEQAFKAAVGRSRPSISKESDVFHPFSFEEERHAFPSAHAAHAFALAATLDRELATGWVPWVAYPAAGLVAASRVAGREHWPTDVVAGAALGVFASRLAGRLLDGTGAAARPVARSAGARLLLGVGVPVGGRRRPGAAGPEAAFRSGTRGPDDASP